MVLNVRFDTALRSPEPKISERSLLAHARARDDGRTWSDQAIDITCAIEVEIRLPSRLSSSAVMEQEERAQLCLKQADGGLSFFPWRLLLAIASGRAST